MYPYLVQRFKNGFLEAYFLPTSYCFCLRIANSGWSRASNQANCHQGGTAVVFKSACPVSSFMSLGYTGACELLGHNLEANSGVNIS